MHSSIYYQVKGQNVQSNGQRLKYSAAYRTGKTVAMQSSNGQDFLTPVAAVTMASIGVSPWKVEQGSCGSTQSDHIAKQNIEKVGCAAVRVWVWNLRGGGGGGGWLPICRNELVCCFHLPLHPSEYSW